MVITTGRRKREATGLGEEIRAVSTSDSTQDAPPQRVIGPPTSAVPRLKSRGHKSCVTLGI